MSGPAQYRLAVIVGADVAGYSARTEADSRAAAAEALAVRARLQAVAAKHGGRVFNTAGDGAMLEFHSARDAASAIVDLIEERPAGEPALRVGGHLGDVSVAENGDLLGHGVNVAARLLAAAQPGCALVSAELKAALGATPAPPMRPFGDMTLDKMQTRISAYEIAPRTAGEPAPAAPAHGERMSIGVLPFLNMSSDPEQEYFSDGVTEDIITDLARWPSLAVLSRNATFTLKGQPVDIPKVGRALGARFLVEGSVRRIGERIRITAQLIDAESGKHVWAERFDRSTADLFAVQDEVVRTIVATLVGRVYSSEAERLRRKPPSSLAAYDLTLRGNALPWDASPIEARACFERAMELDPTYGLPCSLAGVMYLFEWLHDPFADDALLEQALALARRGVELADNESTCQSILGSVHLRMRSFDLAQRHLERGAELNPASPWRHADLGSALTYLGRPEEALERLETARRADPYFGPGWYWRDMGLVHFALRRYAEGLAHYERATIEEPRCLGVMAACAAQLGLAERARELIGRCQALRPALTVRVLMTRLPFKREDDVAHLAEGLRLAGLPD